MLAEPALSIERPWQNAGVGTELLRCLLVVAANRGLRAVTMVTLRENRRTLAVARKFGAEFTTPCSGVQARFGPIGRDLLSLLQESVGEGFAVWQTLLGAGRVAAQDDGAQSRASTCSTSVTQ